MTLVVPAALYKQNGSSANLEQDYGHIFHLPSALDSVGIRLSGDTYNRLALGTVLNAPALGFGLGSATGDTIITRSAAGELTFSGPSTSAIGFGVGSSPADAILSRGAAGVLTLTTGTQIEAPALKVSGITGAVHDSRFVGLTITGSPPASGAHEAGDVVFGTFVGFSTAWVCTTAGTPGTWAQLNSGQYQPLDTDLTAIAALTSAADKIPYATGAGTWALTDFTSTARSLLDDTSTAAMLTTLGAAPTASPTFTGTLTTPIWLAADGTAAHGQITTQPLAAGTQAVAGKNDTGDTLPMWAVGCISGLYPAVGLYLAPANAASDVNFRRDATAACSITGQLTINTGLTMANAKDIVLNTSTGTKIGTATTQKLGFFNATPVVQQTAATELGTALSNLGLRASGLASLETRTTFSNAAATVASPTTVESQVGTMSASRVVTLPAANAYPAGYTITIADESGTVSNTNTLVLTCAGSDTFFNTGQTTEAIRTPGGFRQLMTDGTSKWIVVAQPNRMNVDLYNPGIVAATHSDQAIAASTFTITAATQFFARVPLPKPIVIANVVYHVTTLAASNTNCYVAWYDSGGTMRAQSADLSTPWQSTGIKTTALSYTPVWTGPDTFGWVMFYAGTAGTPPQFRAGGNSTTIVNIGMTAGGAAGLRFGSIALANTATMPNITPSGMATANNLPVVCIT